MHTCVHTPTCTYTRAYMHKHACTHAHSDMHTQAQMRTRVSMRILTHTCMAIPTSGTRPRPQRAGASPGSQSKAGPGPWTAAWTPMPPPPRSTPGLRRLTAPPGGSPLRRSAEPCTAAPSGCCMCHPHWTATSVRAGTRCVSTAAGSQCPRQHRTQHTVGI